MIEEYRKYNYIVVISIIECFEILLYESRVTSARRMTAVTEHRFVDLVLIEILLF